MKYKHTVLMGGANLLALAVHSPIVIAAEYLSIDSAQHSAFSQADRFEELNLVITTEQQQAILALAGAQPAHGKFRSWRASRNGQLLGYFFVDEVIGRQDLITYALGIDITGNLSDVEILTYRESHGGEIKNRAWRQQFAGRDNLTKLRFAIDIKNIAGATLSSEHVTQGVRWLRALWQVALQGL